MGDEWRDRLLALRAELENAAVSGAESTEVVELDQSKVGRLSRMDAMQAQAMAKAASNRRQAMLLKITAALKRIDAGDFGICRRCEEDINPKRLEFDPTALYCIECASNTDEAA